MRFLLPTLLLFAASCSASPPLRPYVPNSAPRAVVRLDADDANAVLEGRIFGGDFAPICEAPCGKALPLELEWRVNGPGITPSKAFTIQGPTIVHAHTVATSTRLLFGVPLIVGGGLVATVGTLTISFVESNSNDRLTARREATFGVAGLGLAIGGLGVAFLLSATSVAIDTPTKASAALRLTPDGFAVAF